MDQRRFSSSKGQARNCGAAVVATSLLALAVPMVAGAEESFPLGRVDSVRIYHAPVEQRRLEVMNVLSTSVSAPPVDSPRRRMSREERDALNRELREVIRGAYQPRPGPAD